MSAAKQKVATPIQILLTTISFALVLSACVGPAPSATATTVVLPTIPSVTASPEATAKPSTPTAAATAEAAETTATPAPTDNSAPTWYTKAVEIPNAYRVSSFEWKSIGVLTGYFNDDLLTVDALTGQWIPTIPTATPATISTTPESDNGIHFSPNQKYVINCNDQRVELFRFSGELVNVANNGDPDICFSISWAPDSSAVAFFIKDNLYIWQIDGIELKKPVSYHFTEPPHWSPDSKRLIVIRISDSDAGSATFDIVYASNLRTIVTSIQIGINDWYPSALNWLTNDLLINWHGCGMSCSFTTVYDAYSGAELLHWGSDNGQTQAAAFSPNEQWLMVSNNYFDPQPGFPNGAIDYLLFNLRTKQLDTLVKGQEAYLQYLGWSSDSATFYLVSRPTTSTALAPTNLPFGLLAFDPQTQTATQLFKDAVFAKWSPNSQLLWVLFPARQTNGDLGLAGGIFDLASGNLHGRETVSEQMFYADPAAGDLTSVAWSNNSQRLIYADSKGGLFIMDLNCSVQQLASQLPKDTWPANVKFTWSPNDERVLVQFDEQAWIVSVP